MTAIPPEVRYIDSIDFNRSGGIICRIKFVPDLCQKAGKHEPAGEGMGRDGIEAGWFRARRGKASN